ncbi:hypothetical protein ACK3TF_005562 [Chlorella vulgaris]
MLSSALTSWRLAAGRASLVMHQSVRSERRALRSAAVTAAAVPQDPSSQPLPPHWNGRPSKSAAKLDAKQFQDISRKLARLSDKQLARLEPLVGEEVVEAVALAASISHRNQGRQRQEGLVAKMLRESETDAAELQAAIESVKWGQGIIANPAAEQRVQLWMEALLAGDAAAVTQVFAVAQSNGKDLQQMRQLLRQAQQPPAAQAAASAPPGSEESSSSDVEGAAAAAGGAITGSAPRPSAKAASARKQLRKLLQPLAQQSLEEVAADGS